jgi:hypothetical protein
MSKFMRNAEKPRWLMNFTGKIVRVKYVDSQAISISCGRSIAIAMGEVYAALLDSKYALYNKQSICSFPFTSEV